MQVIKFFVFIMLCSAISKAENPQFLKKVFLGSGNDTLPYRILYPENFSRNQTYPLLIFLHGAGERGSDNEKQLLHGSHLFLDAQNRKNFPAIVIFPQCPLEEWWVNRQLVEDMLGDDGFSQESYPPSTPMRLLLELVDHYTSQSTTDTRRVYLMGLSMGAFGIFDLLTRYPDRFAAAVPICGAGDSRKAEKYARELSFWIFHGEKDQVVPVEGSRKMKKSIQEAGGQVIYTEYPGVDHNSWDPAFAEPNLLPWIFSQTRKQ